MTGGRSDLPMIILFMQVTEGGGAISQALLLMSLLHFCVVDSNIFISILGWSETVEYVRCQCNFLYRSENVFDVSVIFCTGAKIFSMPV